MAETITIVTSELKDKVKEELSSLGKRGTDKQGKTLFASTTLSSTEESLLGRYMSEGIDVILGELSPLVTSYTDEDNIYIELSIARVSAGKKEAFLSNMKAFVVSYALQKALGLSGNEEAAKNQETSMQRHLQAAARLTFCKDAPTLRGYRVSDMKGEISFEE